MSPADALANIEAQRRAAHVNQARFAAALGMSERTYRDLIKRPPRFMHAGRFVEMRATLNALAREQRPGEVAGKRSLRQVVEAWIAFVARRRHLDVAFVLGIDMHRSSFDPRWLEATRCRAVAIYCVNAGLGSRQAELAAALGVTRARVCQIVRSIEDFRDDDPTIDGLIGETLRFFLGEVFE